MRIATLGSWPQEGAARRRFFSILLLLALILFAILRVNIGISHSHVPLSDESHRLGGAYRAIANGTFSLSAYDHLYGLLFFGFGLDAVSAHRVFRVIASGFSTIAMFLFLLSLPRVAPLGAFLAALLWNINLLNVPYVQDYNHSLFAFAVAITAAALWLWLFAGRVPFVGSLLFLPAAFMRPEYWVMPVLAAIWDASAVLRGRWRARWFRMSVFGAAGLALIVFMLPGPRQPLFAAAGKAGQYIDGYLFFGLQQCYTAFLLRHGEIQGIHWGYEFGRVMDEAFPRARGFFHAATVNPGEFFRYILLNPMDNVAGFPRMLYQHSVILPMSVEAITPAERYHVLPVAERWLFLAGFAASLAAALIYGLRRFSYGALVRIVKDPRLYALLMLAVVALPAVVLLIPRPRYWITLVPIAYFGVAFAISRFVAIRSPLHLALISTIAALILSPPVFLSKYTGSAGYFTAYVSGVKEVLRSARRSDVRLYGVRASVYCDMLLPMSCTGEDLGGLIARGATFSGVVEHGEADCLIVDDWLRGTRQYRREQSFFEEFEATPGKYGFDRVYQLESFSIYCARSLFW